MLRDVSGCGGDGRSPPATRQRSVTLVCNQCFLTSGTRGQLAQPLTTTCPDVQFMENSKTETLNLTDEWF